MSNLMLDVDQAGELKAAFRRGNWTNAQIKKLCEGDLLAKLLLVLEGGAEIVVKSILALVKTITAAAIASKKTSACFTDKSRYYYRDSDLDAWLPEMQSDQAEGNLSVYRLTQNATFKRVVESFLDQTGDVKTLSRLLKERGAITTLPTIESLIERQEAGEDVGLRTDGWANFFFVENKNEENNEEGSLSVVYVGRGGGRWDVSVGRLGLDRVWYGEDRFFFRN